MSFGIFKDNKYNSPRKIFSSTQILNRYFYHCVVGTGQNTTEAVSISNPQSGEVGKKDKTFYFLFLPQIFNT
jgi:hypothetical protein